MIKRKNFEKIGNLHGQNVPANVPVNVPVNETEKSILDIINEDNHVTHLEISKKLNITEKTAKRNTSKLRSKGLLKRHGADKNGYWEIVK